MLDIYRNFLAIIFIVHCSIEAKDPELFTQVPARVITNENFIDVISQPSLGTFVMYQAPWCGHCKRMLPIWSELSTAHNSQGRFIIAKVDCTLDTELCSNEDVLRYPTFVFYKKADSIGHRLNSELITVESFELFMFDKIYERKSKDEEDATDEEKKIVNNLNAQNFDQAISKGFYFVKFFVPWCGHCKSMEQVWKDLAGVNPKVEIAEVNCELEALLCQEKKIKGYPALRLYHDGKEIDSYTGERQFESLVNFMKNQVEKAVDRERGDKSIDQVDINDLLVLTSLNSESTFAKPGLLFVKFFAPWCGHCKTMAPDWIEFAKSYKTVKQLVIAEVDCTKESSLCRMHDVKGYPSLILFENGERVNNGDGKYQGRRDLESFSKFVTPFLEKYHDEL